MKPNWPRRVVWIVVIAAIIAVFAYSFRPQPKLVDIATATHGPLEITIEEVGKTRVIDRYTVSAPVAGTTCRTDLRIGDRVTQGQTLLTIRPQPSQALDPRSQAAAQARIAATEAALHGAEQRATSATADADLARKAFERLQSLATQGHVAREQLDQAAARLRGTQALQRSADFAIEVARHELEAARTALRYTGVDAAVDPADIVPVRSPTEGRVLMVQQTCEGIVNAGQALMEIGDTQSLEIETEVLSADAVKINVGMRVIYDRWGGERPLEGTVRRVEPVGFTKVSALGVEEQRVRVISDITTPVEVWQSLGDGYRVEARFILWEEARVLQIPASALFRSNGNWAAFVVDNRRARRREVTLGQRNGLAAQIVDGIATNDLVITHPDDAIEDGIAVRARR
ncbi:MAG: efflux RND transporter periplasmic adaptor subunit [Thiotrichales bacterium]